MVFNLNNEVEREDFKEYVNSLYKQKGIVEVKKKHRSRSLSQNSYLHVCLSYYASEFGGTMEEVKFDIFKKVVNRSIFARERLNKRGEKVFYWRSTTDLDTKEMTEAIERFRNYCSSFAGLYIPAPNETDALLEAQKQISLYEQYL